MQVQDNLEARKDIQKYKLSKKLQNPAKFRGIF